MRRTASSRSARRIILACAAALALGASAGLTAVGAAAAGTSGPAAVRQAPLVVRTTDGNIRGLSKGAVREVLGVPYAASTAGAQRWRPPRPHAPWRGIMKTAKPGPTCAQTASLATGVLPTTPPANSLTPT